MSDQFVNMNPAADHRSLGSSFLVDKNGNEYDPDSLAWRYLGAYVDCDAYETSDQYEGDDFTVDDDDGVDDDNDDGGQSNRGGGCQRHILWAAYFDLGYRGNAIEEYQRYDVTTGEWDRSACRRRGRCARMDCHEQDTHFRLAGVFKQTDGMYDWNTELFKHEGYCLLNNKTLHRTMQWWIEKWPTSCRELNQPDDYGNTLYIDIQPLPGGNVTMGIYTDEKCSLPSESVNLERYIIRAYHAYVNNDDGYQVGMNKAYKFIDGIETWNENMNMFKVCQPCRTYNPFNGSSYDCIDYDGYTNTDQCSKFETNTNLEVASREDLEIASGQGTMLRIEAYGSVFGEGGYTSPRKMSRLVEDFVSVAIVAALSIVILVVILAQRIKTLQLPNLMMPKLQRLMLPAPLREAINVAALDARSQGYEMKIFHDHGGASDESGTICECKSSSSGDEYERRKSQWKANQMSL